MPVPPPTARSPVACSPAGSTTQLIHSKHPSPGTGSGHNVPKFPSFQPPANLLLLPWVPLGEHRNRPKTTLQPSTSLFKESKSSGSPLDIPVRNHSGFAPVPISAFVTAPDCLTAAPGAAGLHPPGLCNTQPWWGGAVTPAVCTHRDCSGCLLVTHAWLMPFKPVGSSVFGQ